MRLRNSSDTISRLALPPRGKALDVKGRNKKSDSVSNCQALLQSKAIVLISEIRRIPKLELEKEARLHPMCP